MARKSSFLQGFEVGADLYNRGFSQAQSMAQMKLQQDAQGLQKKKMEAELRAIARAEEEAKRKLLTRAKANESFKNFLELHADYDFSNPQDVQLMANSLFQDGYYNDISKSPELKNRLEGWIDGIKNTEGGKLLAAFDLNKAAEIQANAKITLAQKETVRKFNEKYGTTYKDITEVNKWQQVLDSQLDMANKTGEYDSAAIGDFEGYSRANELLNTAAATKARTMQQEVEMTGAKATATSNASAMAQQRMAGIKRLIDREDDFYKYTEEQGLAHLDYRNPEHRKQVVTHKQRNDLIQDFKEGGAKAIKLINGLSVDPQTGAYDQDELADAYGQLANMKAEVKKSGERINLTEAQSKSVMYGVAMYQAQQEFAELAKEGYIALSARDRAAAFVAGKLGDISFKGVSDQGQRYLTAMQNWNNAKLRKDSGAAITVAEVENYTQSLFPRLGEGKEGIEAKQRARDAAYFALKKGAGPGLEDFWQEVEGGLQGIPSTIPSTPEKPSVQGGSARRPGTSPANQMGSSNPPVHTFSGTNEENKIEFDRLVSEGMLKKGDTIRVLGADGVYRNITVPGGSSNEMAPAQDQPDPTPNQMAPTGAPEGQPAPRQLPEVENDAARGQTDMQSDQAPQPDEELERAPSETGQPVGIEPEMPMVVGDEFRTSGEITEDQLQESEVMREFQDLASNGGGENPYAFRRHRVKIGNTTGEIVRTNSRGVFIKIPNGPTRFMSWGGLSKRIESGDFKPNKARLNQQLKGE